MKNLVARTRGLGAASLALAVWGLVLFWWVPFGLVLSAAALVVSAIGALLAPPTARERRFVAAGAILALVGIVLEFATARGMVEPTRWWAW